MSKQSDRQDRALALLQRIGSGAYSPVQAVKDFTAEEINECKKVAFQGGYGIAHFGLEALWMYLQLRNEGDWLPVPGSRPAHNTVVWISYVYDGARVVDKGFLDGSGWHLDGEARVPVEPYGWRPMEPSPMKEPT